MTNFIKEIVITLYKVGEIMNYKRRQPPPEELIGPRVNFLSRLVRCKFNDIISEEGLYSGQQDILFAVLENEGITSSKLAEITGVSAATMSVSVKRMEKAGFIVKKPDENDARIMHIYPTEKAKAVPGNTREKINELELILKKGMDEDKALEFAHYLQRAIDNLLEEFGNCCEKGDE